MINTYDIYLISDSTGETLERIFLAIKAQFKNFDYKFEGTTEFTIPHFSKMDEDFGIGVIYGSSGSGKSSMLKQFGVEQELVWDYNKTIASHFDSVEDAIERLGAVGLNTVPTWAKPRNVYLMVKALDVI